MSAVTKLTGLTLPVKTVSVGRTLTRHDMGSTFVVESATGGAFTLPDVGSGTGGEITIMIGANPPFLNPLVISAPAGTTFWGGGSTTQVTAVADAASAVSGVSTTVSFNTGSSASGDWLTFTFTGGGRIMVRGNTAQANGVAFGV